MKFKKMKGIKIKWVGFSMIYVSRVKNGKGELEF